MVPGIDVRVDYAFKRLFGVEQNRGILMDLLNAILDLPPDRRIVEVELLNPFHSKEFHDDKLSIVDVKARERSGRVLIVEMQMVAFEDLPKRFLHYWATSYRQQISEGEGYSNLHPVILIAIVHARMFGNPPGRELPYHLRFQLQEVQHGVVFSEDIELHTIELSKLRKTIEQLESPLDVWAYFLEHAMELDTEAIPAPLSSDSIRHALQEMIVIAHSKEERELYEARLMRQRDDQARLEDALRRGRREGREEGREEERLLQLRKSLRILERALAEPALPESVLVGMTLRELEARVNELERRFLSTPQP